MNNMNSEGDVKTSEVSPADPADATKEFEGEVPAGDNEVVGADVKKRHDPPPPTIYECESNAKLLELISKMLGKPGPKYLNVGVIEHNYLDWLEEDLRRELEESGKTDVIEIGKANQPITLVDIQVAFERAAHDPLLARVRNGSYRSYFAEGYDMSDDGNTLYMGWGS